MACSFLCVAMATHKTIIDFLLTKISNLLRNSQFEQLCSTQNVFLQIASLAGRSTAIKVAGNNLRDEIKTCFSYELFSFFLFFYFLFPLLFCGSGDYFAAQKNGKFKHRFMFWPFLSDAR